jgi:hypothetical protein
VTQTAVGVDELQQIEGESVVQKRQLQRVVGDEMEQIEGESVVQKWQLQREVEEVEAEARRTQ